MRIDMMLVTKENYPTIFEAFEKLAHDTGNQAGHKNYAISLEWEDKLSSIEYELHLLNNKDFEDLCIGEESDREKIACRSLKLSTVDRFLQEVFEEM